MATEKALLLPARNLHQCVLSPSEWMGLKKKKVYFSFVFFFKKPKPNANCAACAVSWVQTCVKVDFGFPWSRGFMQLPGQKWPCVSLFFLPRLYLQHDNPEAVLPQWWGSDWCSQGPPEAPGHLQPGHRHPLKREPARWEPPIVICISWMSWLQVLWSLPPCLTAQPEGNIRNGFELAKINEKSGFLVEICTF